LCLPKEFPHDEKRNICHDDSSTYAILNFIYQWPITIFGTFGARSEVGRNIASS